MRLGIYMDNNDGNLFLVYKVQRWIEYSCDRMLGTSQDGYYDTFYRIEFSSQFTHHTLERDYLSELAWELRNHTYLGKL